MSKFKVGQEVIVTSGVMSYKRGKIVEVCEAKIPILQWYKVLLNDLSTPINYLEQELESLN